MGLETAIPIFGKLFAGMKQNKLANEINPQDITYRENPYARQNLGIINQLFNARMPGAAAAGRQISANQANQMNNVNRLATDSSTALALGLASEGQANEAANQLAMQEGSQKYGLLDNLSSAYKTLIGEGDKVYQDQLRKFNNDVNEKSALRKSSMENLTGFGSDLLSAGITAATGGLGAFGKVGGAMKGAMPNFNPQNPYNAKKFSYDAMGNKYYLD